MNAYEEHFIRSFIVPDKQPRYLTLLGSKRGRSKLLDGLNHCSDLDPRFSTELSAIQQSVEAIESILRSKGAGDTCWIMSDNRDIDGLEMSLVDALSETIGGDAGTLISCIPGKLAYFEMEGRDGSYILER
jgi:hypothetical protein